MRVLTQRSQKDRTGWDRINRLVDQWLPKPRILHPWPNHRFAVKHPRWQPDAGMPHVRFCAEGPSNEHPYRNPLASWTPLAAMISVPICARIDPLDPIGPPLVATDPEIYTGRAHPRY
jgi:hypothetical protein